MGNFWSIPYMPLIKVDLCYQIPDRLFMPTIPSKSYYCSGHGTILFFIYELSQCGATPPQLLRLLSFLWPYSDFRVVTCIYLYVSYHIVYFLKLNEPAYNLANFNRDNKLSGCRACGYAWMQACPQFFVYTYLKSIFELRISKIKFKWPTRY